MRTLAFDGRTGASGDMVLGALLDAGADPATLAPVEDAIDVHFEVREVRRAGIAATSVAVQTVVEDGDDGGDGGHEAGEGAGGDEHGHEIDHHGHEHDHDDHGHGHHGHGHHGHGHHGHDHHEHEQGDEHGHDHGSAGDDRVPAEGHGPHRSHEEVQSIVAEMGLPEAVERRASAVFRRLGEAEAAVHGTALDEIHFHEVGADDAIADVVGAALLLDDLDVERVVTTPVAAGGGEVTMHHGTYPVPAPAVAETAADADWELRGGPVDRELLTPTGAAILAAVAEGVDALPDIDVEATGYGAGSIDLADRPNVLRAIVGQTGGGLRSEEIVVLETNLDDATPEVLGGLQETLAPVGAKDVTVVPTTMKKSRPGHLVKVICDPADAEAVATRLAEETGTLGVRATGAGHRWVADRSVEAVEIDVDGTDFGVRVKVATDADGTIYDVSAEFDDALAVAEETDLPVRDVIRRAESAARE